MRLPNEYYQIQQTIAQHFPHLRPSQKTGLSLWVYGCLLANSATQSAVLAALWTVGKWNSLRQYLREWLYDGVNKARPNEYQVEVFSCFLPLMKWLLSLWRSDHLAMAIDTTMHGDKLASLVVSVLYRGCAIPVAWHILPANKPAPWIVPILGLLEAIHPAIPNSMEVIVLVDRGLRSPRLWNQIVLLGWHPVMRVRRDTVFQPLTGHRLPATNLIPGPGYAWVGAGTAFAAKKSQRFGTLIVLWDEGQAEPWVVLTDFAVQKVDVSWYGLRVWIELGFRALKGVGWQWQRTRRTEPQRVSRHWLVMAIATLLVMGSGTRVEDGIAQGKAPCKMRAPVDVSALYKRTISVFRRGITCLRSQLLKGRMWHRLWLVPEPWPTASAKLHIHYHFAPLGAPY